MTADMENAVTALQHEVQRRLGRCMLRLQQYEHLLKVLVGSMAVAGPPEQLHAIRDRQVADVHGRTLGTLVGMFTSHHLIMESADSATRPDEATGGNRPPDAPWASIGFTIGMPPERHAQTKAGLAELVDLRNDLVHHLIERFSISDGNGCRAACDHLDACYRRIDGHYRTLRSWSAILGESQARMAELLQSKAFEDVFVHRANPDGPACWPGSPIVECLREAEKACMKDGWTSLNAAVGFIAKTSRDQVPSRYGCRTWRQLLQRSGQFEIRSIAGSRGAAGQTWYRSRQDTPQSAPGCRQD